MTANSQEGAGVAKAPTVPLKGKSPRMGGPTLADAIREIEHRFDGDNKTDGLVARFGRKDILDDDGDVRHVSVFVVMVPAPDEQEQTITHTNVLGKEETSVAVIEVFDPAKIQAHDVGDRVAATGATFGEAIGALATKLGMGGDK